MCSSAKPPTKVPYPPSQLFILTTHCVHQSGDRGPTTSLKKLVRGKRLAGWIVWKGHVGDNFHPTSRYPASHAINASSTSTTKGRASTPAKRLEEFIEKELNWDAGDDPAAQFNIRGNWTNRKFGNSGSYRHVEEAVCYMLGLTATEAQKWIFDFLAPMRETMKAGE